MAEKITYAVFYKAVATDYDPHPVWRQYDGWEECLAIAKNTLAAAKKNPRFAECKIVERTETFNDYGSEALPYGFGYEVIGDIIVCAVRYACGRRSYITSTVSGFVKPMIHKLESNTLRVIRSSINEVEKNAGGLGDPGIDDVLWRDLRDACTKELKQRGDDK